MLGYMGLVVAVTYASIGGLFVGLGYLMRYRERTDLIDTPSWRSITDRTALARYLGLWTGCLGLIFLGIGTGFVLGYVRLIDTWGLFIVSTVGYLALVVAGNVHYSTPESEPRVR